MYRPKDRNELEQLIVDCYRGELYLKDIDTSLINSMSFIFNIYYNRELHSIDINKIWDDPNNDISNWDTSNVTDMSWMFSGCEFNQDISKWNTSNVTNMYGMFYESKFNQDISMWDVSNVKTMSTMFTCSEFNQDISEWNVSCVTDMNDMFAYSEFNRNLSIWILSLNPNVDMYIFNSDSSHSKIYGEIGSYDDFLKSVNWDRVKGYIKEVMKNSSNSERYKLLKRLNNFRQFSDIELDLSK